MRNEKLGNNGQEGVIPAGAISARDLRIALVAWYAGPAQARQNYLNPGRFARVAFIGLRNYLAKSPRDDLWGQAPQQLRDGVKKNVYFTPALLLHLGKDPYRDVFEEFVQVPDSRENINDFCFDGLKGAVVIVLRRLGLLEHDNGEPDSLLPSSNEPPCP